jgi:Flp pilus assembly pilin Flp
MEAGSPVPRPVGGQQLRSDTLGARVKNTFNGLLLDEEGASLVEYILLAVLIGVAAIAGMGFLGKTTNNRMNNIGTAVE